MPPQLPHTTPHATTTGYWLEAPLTKGEKWALWGQHGEGPTYHNTPFLTTMYHASPHLFAHQMLPVFAFVGPQPQPRRPHLQPKGAAPCQLHPLELHLHAPRPPALALFSSLHFGPVPSMEMVRGAGEIRGETRHVCGGSLCWVKVEPVAHRVAIPSLAILPTVQPTAALNKHRVVAS